MVKLEKSAVIDSFLVTNISMSYTKYRRCFYSPKIESILNIIEGWLKHD